MLQLSKSTVDCVVRDEYFDSDGRLLIARKGKYSITFFPCLCDPLELEASSKLSSNPQSCGLGARRQVYF